MVPDGEKDIINVINYLIEEINLISITEEEADNLMALLE